MKFVVEEEEKKAKFWAPHPSKPHPSGEKRKKKKNEKSEEKKKRKYGKKIRRQLREEGEGGGVKSDGVDNREIGRSSLFP